MSGAVGWSTALRQSTRKPLAGVALAAVAGVALAEAWRAWFLARDGDGSVASTVVASLFAVLTAAWWGCHSRRPALGKTLFWCAVAAGYAALHLFGSDPVAAGSLARRLASPITTIAAVDDPENASAHVLHAVGTVLDLPHRTPTPAGGANWRFTAGLATAGIDGGEPLPCHAPVAVEWRDGPRHIDIGDQVELTALAANVAPPRNPGEFDEETFLRRQGILSELRLRGVADGRVLAPSSAGPWMALPWVWSMQAARRCHDWMADRLGDDVRADPEASAVISTALLGLRERPGLGALEPAFQRTGTIHFFAIDGLKLGLVSLLLLRLLTFLGLPRPWPGVLVLPLLLGYALATGLGSASARAVLVAAAFMGGEALDRPVRPVNSLGAAAALLLLFDTQQLFELSFQLTFLVVLAILTFAPPLHRRLMRLGAPDPFVPTSLFPWTRRAGDLLREGTYGLVAVSIAAWLGSLPLMLLYFHFVSPVSPLANVVVFPFAFAVLALGVLSLAGSVVWRMLGIWLNNANWLAAKTLILLVRASDAVPGGSVAVAAPEHWHLRPPAAEIVVLDLGRARAACLRAGRADWLIDAARPLEYTRGVLPCLRAWGIDRLDGLLLTQGDADHLAAARLALTELLPTRVVDPALTTGSTSFRDFRKLLAAQSRQEIPCRRGDRIVFSSGVAATALYPPDDLPGRLRAAADRALALRIDAAGWRVLWLPEGDGAAGQWLLTNESPGALASDVIVTAGPTIPAALLAAVRPRLVVLRAPVERKAPRAGVIAADAGSLPEATTFRQTESGAVAVRFYPDRIEAQGFVDDRRMILTK